MGFDLATTKNMSALRDKAMRLQSRVKGAVAKANEVVEVAVRSAEVNAAAFTAGVIQGYWGSVGIVGIPVDLGAGAAGHALAFMMGGKNAEHLHNFADGFLAAYTVTAGRGVGQKLKSKAGTAVKGVFDAI